MMHFRSNNIGWPGARTIQSPREAPCNERGGHSKHMALSDCLSSVVHRRNSSTHVIWRCTRNGQAVLEVGIFHSHCSHSLTLKSFSICHGPTPDERRLMQDWIQILIAFVNDDEDYEFGTKAVDEMRLATPQATIEVQQDKRWHELVRIGEVFAGKSL